ncbi:MAG: hypothetical protein WKF91_17570 [Segetibacter sp.]
MKIYKAILVLFFVSTSIIIKGQKIERFNSFSYNVNDGLLQSNVLDIAFDKNNFCWLSFANGIQKFDGKILSPFPCNPACPMING